MDSRETFVVTLFCDPRRSDEPGGRLRHVVTGQEATFRNLDELNRLLQHFLNTGEVQNDESKT